ncbi:hypothetical protein [Azospirillum sp. TSO22-1]|uniref:hypothetical protein n=1 Tax=Azospirillum sp. TSO22-1 TaxID=716789 RepID=UPI0011B6ADDC|nr:hypothetical protein [Azospirillum sp. TSO22-1]
MRSRTIFAATLALALAACASQTELYDRSVARSAVFEESNVRPLTPLAYPVQALTYTTYPDWAAGSVGGTVKLARETWITVEPEVSGICRSFPKGEVVPRLNQLLGLKPATETDLAKRRFVRLRIDGPQKTGPTSAGVFRPCADPDPYAKACGNTVTGSPEYVAWFANWAVGAHQLNPDVAKTGYPWTRLGYTYNWDPAVADIRGAQEYVVPKDTEVTVVGVVDPAEYCAGR